MKRIFLIAMLVASPAFAQDDGPSLSTLLPVLSTDAARMANELTALMKAAQDAQARAEYWQDACKSTPECGGPNQVAAVEKKSNP